MSEEFAKEIHHQVKRKFKRRQVVVTGLDEIWAMDLASMESFVSYNDGYKYILCIIDVFSKFAWCVPLKNKTGASILKAVKDITSQSGRSPEKIWVDKGSEFYNKEFQSWAKSNNITIYSTYGESKSVVVERFIRTLKELLTRKFSATNSREWIKMLPGILNFYNHKYHSTIDMSPIDASDPANEVQVYNNIYKTHGKEKKKKKKPKFHVGDHVRVSRIKEKFEKGFQPNFSHEVFTISEVLHTSPFTYKLIDYDKDPIEGSFYEQELLKTSVPEHYEVESILETRGVGKKKEYFVKFYGWPKKFNTWLSEDQLMEIPGEKKGLEEFLDKRTRNTSKFWESVLEEK
jgi:integrase-like protein/chromodomain-containing protein